MIIRIKVEIIAQNFIVGLVDDVRYVVLLPYDEIMELIGYFNIKGVPISSLYYKLGSPIFVGGVDDDISLVSLKSVELITDNIYRAKGLVPDDKYYEPIE